MSGEDGYRALLARNVERMQAAYDTKRADLAARFPDFEPEEITDPNGRSILLDSLVVLVSAQTALLPVTGAAARP